MVLFRRLQHPLVALLLAGWMCVLWPPQAEAAVPSDSDASPAAFGHDLPPQAQYAPSAPKAAPSHQRGLGAALLVATLAPTATLSLGDGGPSTHRAGHRAPSAFPGAPTRAP